MKRSDTSSRLILIAGDPRDAEAWQAKNPELADAVSVVLVGWGLDGLIATAVIFTEGATNHPEFTRALDSAERAVLKLAPSRGWWAWPTFVDVGIKIYSDALERIARFMAAKTRTPTYFMGDV